MVIEDPKKTKLYNVIMYIYFIKINWMFLDKSKFISSPQFGTFSTKLLNQCGISHHQ